MILKAINNPKMILKAINNPKNNKSRR